MPHSDEIINLGLYVNSCLILLFIKCFLEFICAKYVYIDKCKFSRKHQLSNNM